MSPDIETYDDPFADDDEWTCRVNDAIVITNCYKTPTMYIEARVGVEVGDNPHEFVDDATITQFWREYDQDGNTVRSGVST